MDTLDPQPFEAMGEEYDAWQMVVLEAREHGIDFNQGQNGELLHAAIARWGEELTQLRMLGSQEVADRALNERREQHQKLRQALREGESS